MREDDSRSDRQLFDAINRGDAAAFAALYHRYRDWVARLAVRFTGNDEDALDVLQETFAYLLRKVPRLTLSCAMTTFLYPAVKNLAIAARRKRARFIGPADADDSLPAPPLPPGDPRGDLAEALRDLPPQSAEVLLMRFVDGLSLEEIGQALSVPLGTVKSRLHNALKTLRDDPRTRERFGVDPRR